MNPITEQHLLDRAKVEAEFAQDHVLKRLEREEAEYNRREQARILGVKADVARKEAELGELKKQRRILSGKIVNKNTSLKAARIRARYRKQVPMRIERKRCVRKLRLKVAIIRRERREFTAQMNREWYDQQLHKPVARNS